MSGKLKRFGFLLDDAKAAFGGIAAARAKGDIGLAARILWLTLKMEWQRGVSWLTEIWIGWKYAFLTAATDAFYGLKAIWTKVFYAIKTAWVYVVEFVRRRVHD